MWEWLGGFQTAKPQDIVSGLRAGEVRMLRLASILALILLSVACNQFKGTSKKLSCPPDQFPAGDTVVTCTPCDPPTIDYKNNPNAAWDDLLQKKLKEQAEKDGYCVKGGAETLFPPS